MGFLYESLTHRCVLCVNLTDFFLCWFDAWYTSTYIILCKCRRSGDTRASHTNVDDGPVKSSSRFERFDLSTKISSCIKSWIQRKNRRKLRVGSLKVAGEKTMMYFSGLSWPSILFLLLSYLCSFAFVIFSRIEFPYLVNAWKIFSSSLFFILCMGSSSI